MLKKKELSFPGEFPEALRSSPGTGSTQAPPEGPRSPAPLHKELCRARPLLSSGGAKAARNKLWQITLTALLHLSNVPCHTGGGKSYFKLHPFYLIFDGCSLNLYTI